MTDSAPEADALIPQGALAAVLTPAPLDRTLDYLAPPGGVHPGDWVEVRIGPRPVVAVVWGPGEGGFPIEKAKPILRALDLPPMPRATRDFLDRAADYTLTERGMMLRLATRAPGLREGPGARRVVRLGPAKPSRLTPARARVLETAEASPDAAWSPAELAREAGVSSAVVGGLVKAGALLEGHAPRAAPFPRLDPSRPARKLSAAQAAAAIATMVCVFAWLPSGLMSRTLALTPQPRERRWQSRAAVLPKPGARTHRASPVCHETLRSGPADRRCAGETRY